MALKYRKFFPSLLQLVQQPLIVLQRRCSAAHFLSAGKMWDVTSMWVRGLAPEAEAFLKSQVGEILPQ